MLGMLWLLPPCLEQNACNPQTLTVGHSGALLLVSRTDEVFQEVLEDFLPKTWQRWLHSVPGEGEVGRKTLWFLSKVIKKQQPPHLTVPCS